MKYFIPLAISIFSLLSVSCSRKYQDFAFIKKSEFQGDSPYQVSERPAKMMAGRKEVENFCEDQILFNKNARDIAEASLPALVSQSCPGSDYLLTPRITRLWWTTLLYTRSCVKVESYCPKN